MTDVQWRETGGHWDEDHTLMTDEELASCGRAYDEMSEYSGAVPTMNISNGEYLPKPQGRRQRQVEVRVRQLIETMASKLNMSRETFQAGPGGIAAGLVAMNEVYGQYFDVTAEDLADPKLFALRGIPKDVFVVDDQLHFVRGRVTGKRAEGLSRMRATGQGPTASVFGMSSNPGNPDNLLNQLGEVWSNWNPSLLGDHWTSESMHLVQFIKDVFLDSQTTVGLISNVTAYVHAQPSGTDPGQLTSAVAARQYEILTAAQTAAARNFINKLAGSRRALCHGMLYTGVGNLDYIQYQTENHKPDSWKGYTISSAAKIDDDPMSLMRRWRQDDEEVAYPTYDLILQNYRKLKDELPGYNNICVHKGLVSDDTPDEPEMGYPSDIPKACRDWPELNFITYHSAIKNGAFDARSYDAVQASESGVDDFLLNGVPNIQWTTAYAQMTSEYTNSYAELGTTFGSLVVAFPAVCAHLLGQLLKYKTEDRILWGTDSVWYGSPQWQLEAFWRFQIPEQMQERWGYPALTEQAKRKILGLNAARIYGLEPDTKLYSPVPADYAAHVGEDLKELMEISDGGADRLTQMKSMYQELGEQRTTLPYGWVRRTNTA